MCNAKFKAGDRVRVVNPNKETIPEGEINVLLPTAEVVGEVGTVVASFLYECGFQPDYDIAMDGKKYKSPKQYTALDERFLELVA